MKPSLSQRVAAEFLGTAFLVTAVVGSGIMAERLSGGNVAVALLANTIATGAALVALILAFGAVSGAHFNPVVSFADALEHGLPYREAFCIRDGPARWGNLGHCDCALDVQSEFDFAVAARSQRTGADFQ